MNLNVDLEQFYPHPPQRVWQAIATSDGLAAWLMPNDFEPVAGRAFTLRFCPPDDTEEEETISATVVELAPPERMVWSWRNESEKEETRVVFELRSVQGGTRLRLRHTGPVSDALARRLRSGWSEKLGGLAKFVAAALRVPSLRGG